MFICGFLNFKNLTINIHDIYKKNLQIKPVIVLDWLISLGFLGHFYNPVLDDKSKKISMQNYQYRYILKC